MKTRTIIILNGTSSSGKTTLLKALQKAMNEPYLDAGIDKFIWMLPGRYLDRPLWDDALGDADRSGELGHRLFSGMHHAIAALSRRGNNVIADHVLVEPEWANECAQLFCDLPAYLIGVRCPLEVVEEREQSRRDRTLGQARKQFDSVHARGVYDLEVDTSVLSVEECVQRVRVLVETQEPRAFKALASGRSLLTCNEKEKCDMTITMTDDILLADAPVIEGLTYQRFRGESDFPLMAALSQECADADQVDDATTPEELANWFAHLTHCDVQKDMLFVEDEAGEMIANCRNWWWREEATGTYIYGHSGRVSPKWRRRGIGRALLHHMQRRIREVSVEQGHPADAPHFLQSWAADTEIAAEKLLTSEGYTPVRHSFEMTRPLVAGEDDIPHFALPDGFEVRPIQPDQWHDLFKADVEAFRDHWGFAEPTEEHFKGWINWKWFRPELFRVAWDVERNEIAGAVENFINEDENAKYNRKRGYTEGIFVRRPYRKRGLARALIAISLQMHKDLGMTETALGVDTENLTGALRVYESCGFRAIKRFSGYRKAF